MVWISYWFEFWLITFVCVGSGFGHAWSCCWCVGFRVWVWLVLGFGMVLQFLISSGCVTCYADELWFGWFCRFGRYRLCVGFVFAEFVLCCLLVVWGFGVDVGVLG